ncbi:serine/threonine protein kinase [Nocardiopsis sp. Huas11]|uniref:serine/threonine-protein kinase n=1 Tax=Nocardiopsis sp. Huas11 TaxID=2183912 RepID=UPI000EAE7CE9|nr:serine/threonine-protein kinase [Nocardiopsis sp. Huas11]RKS08949.1 serine/threonine protein kinase [Nocardiopsis sp. Huas11]
MTTPLTPSDPTTIGPYSLDARIDAGGQGTVYLGRAADGSPAAVKVLTGLWGQDGRQRARFARELAAARTVAPFCTAAVLDADMDADVPYIASEYVPGPTLRSAVTDEGPRTGAALDRLAIAIVTALAAVHEAGVVHRDLKPGNVILGPDGPRVIDFGIARFTDATQQTTTVAGTPAYMAPEQIQGLPASPAGDMFSWAAVMAFAATGRHAFPGENTMAVIDRVLSQEPELEGVPERLLPVLRRCLDKDPAARPSAVQVLDRLIGRTPSAAAPVARTAVLEEVSTAVDQGTARIRVGPWVPFAAGTADPATGGAATEEAVEGGAADATAAGPEPDTSAGPAPGTSNGAGASPQGEHIQRGPADAGAGPAADPAGGGSAGHGGSGGAGAPGTGAGDRWSPDEAPTEREGFPAPGGVAPTARIGGAPTRALSSRPGRVSGGRRSDRRRRRPALVTAGLVAVLGVLAAVLLWSSERGALDPAVPTGSTPSDTPADTVSDEPSHSQEEAPAEAVEEDGSPAPVEEGTHEPEWTPPTTDCHADPHAEGCAGTGGCEDDPAACEETTDEGDPGTGEDTDGGGEGGGTGGGGEEGAGEGTGDGTGGAGPDAGGGTAPRDGEFTTTGDDGES